MIETKNFTWNEITCNWKGNYGVDPTVSGTWALEYNIDPTVEMLQEIRDYVGKPIYINSSYRNIEYNKSVDGEKHSLHLLFKALDFSVKNFKMMDYMVLGAELRNGNIIELNRLGGLGVYKTFLHIDCGPRRDWGIR